MRISELLRLVIINLSQNKFKVILTSVGIIVGSATIMMVLAIGTGGKIEVAEQFKTLTRALSIFLMNPMPLHLVTEEKEEHLAEVECQTVAEYQVVECQAALECRQ